MGLFDDVVKTLTGGGGGGVRESELPPGCGSGYKQSKPDTWYYNVWIKTPVKCPAGWVVQRCDSPKPGADWKLWKTGFGKGKAGRAKAENWAKGKARECQLGKFIVFVNQAKCKAVIRNWVDGDKHLSPGFTKVDAVFEERTLAYTAAAEYEKQCRILAREERGLPPLEGPAAKPAAKPSTGSDWTLPLLLMGGGIILVVLLR